MNFDYQIIKHVEFNILEGCRIEIIQEMLQPLLSLVTEVSSLD